MTMNDVESQNLLNKLLTATYQQRKYIQNKDNLKQIRTPGEQYRSKEMPQDVKSHLVEDKAEKTDKPYVTEIVNKSDHIILNWEHRRDLEVDEFYQIIVKQHPRGMWKAFLRVENCYTGEEGQSSDISDVITTGESAALRIKKKSEKIKDGIPSIFKLPYQEIAKARNEGSLTRKFILGTPRNNTKEKTIMIVGATGSGKSTLIEIMANYVMGVLWEDPFRFTLIHEMKQSNNHELSQTEWITCYTIYSDVSSRIDYTLNIIDTPGFGDTRGVEQDIKIISQFQDFFTGNNTRGVAALDAVCFVVKEPDAGRLTTTQKCIFESILALFGNDIKNNICTLVTFADGRRPADQGALKALEALEALEDKPLPFHIIFHLTILPCMQILAQTHMAAFNHVSGKWE
ncbi:unnamed protein product [Mytilus coruscus]|uniref:Septin-type G domain-containing protein n=1 Tax=Mytilus coruscus TaxID=42192 RepID=A0A6J8DCU5_MYTCO|nr:unnamed protein product [Mytilus coruscus]